MRKVLKTDMKSLTRNRKYCVSTVKISKNLYETSVFRIKWLNTESIGNFYEVDYAEEMDRINYNNWFEQFKYHNLMKEYWSLK
jgi:hypothetical protein